MAKVYVASSWSNEYQPRIVAFLRERGHEVYDFRNPERKTDFRWSQISGNWEKMETDEYLDALVCFQCRNFLFVFFQQLCRSVSYFAKHY